MVESGAEAHREVSQPQEDDTIGSVQERQRALSKEISDRGAYVGNEETNDQALVKLTDDDTLAGYEATHGAKWSEAEPYSVQHDVKKASNIRRAPMGSSRTKERGLDKAVLRSPANIDPSADNFKHVYEEI